MPGVFRRVRFRAHALIRPTGCLPPTVHRLDTAVRRRALGIRPSDADDRDRSRPSLPMHFRSGVFVVPGNFAHSGALCLGYKDGAVHPLRNEGARAQRGGMTPAQSKGHPPQPPFASERGRKARQLRREGERPEPVASGSRSRYPLRNEGGRASARGDGQVRGESHPPQSPFAGEGGRNVRRSVRICGFTLVELMVTLAVAAILLMIAVPSFQHIIASTNLAGVNNDLTGDLQYARTEAVSRQVNVAVAASAGSWQNGWIVGVSSTAGAPVSPVLRRHSPVSPQYKIAYNANGGVAGKLTFQPQGSIVAAGSGVCFTISATHGEHNTPHFLQVTASGAFRQTSGTTTAPTTPACTSP
ncbi:MAG: GspH/FimT family pseudopilin [Rhodanobacteraceae bacterium]